MIIDPIGPAAAVDYRVRRGDAFPARGARGNGDVLRGGSCFNRPFTCQGRERLNSGMYYDGAYFGFRLTVTLPCNESTPVVQ